MDHTRLSESELRDVLDRLGVSTFHVADREALERLYVEQSVFTTGPKSNVGPRNESESETEEVFHQSLDQELIDLEAEVTKKKKILQLREQLAKLDIEVRRTPNPPLNAQPQPDGGRPPRYTFDDVSAAIEVFSGDDKYTVQAFIDNLETAAVQFVWTDTQKATYAKRFLSGTAKSSLRSSGARSWQEIQRELLANFSMENHSVVELLSNRRMQPGESPLQYFFAMREIAAMGQVADPDLIKYITKGVATTQPERLFFAEISSVDSLRKKLKYFSEIVAQSTSSDSSSSYAIPVRRNPFFGQEPAATAPPRRCFNCQEEGHFANACRKPRRPAVCFTCGQEGHMSSQCHRRQVPKQVTNIEFEHGWRRGRAEAIAELQQQFQQDTVCNRQSQDDQSQTRMVPALAERNCQRIPEAHTFNEEVSLLFSNGTVNASFKFVVLLDTGSPSCFIQSKFVPSFFLNRLLTDGDEFVGVNGSRMCVLGTICASILFRGLKSDNVRVYVVSDGTMRSAMILGRNFIDVNGLRLLKSTTLCSSSDNNFNEIAHDVMSIDVSDNNTEPIFQVNTNVPPAILSSLQQLIEKCEIREVFENEPSTVQCAITLTKTDKFYCTPRRLSYHRKEQIRTILDDLLLKNIIRPSNSAYCSPIVPILKKNGELRMCVDYRMLNKISARDNYPLPLIEDQMDLLHDKKYFSCLDLKDGFHHVTMAADSIHLTSFVTPHGQFEFMRMPFGLKNAPSVFQRFINSLFRHLIDANKILVYMDDIMIATNSLDEHLNVLREVFEVIHKNGLILRLSKCKFFFEEVDYLGYRVDHRGIRPNPENIQAVLGFPTPTCVRDVHSFLGLSSYFRKFIKNFAIIAKPLYDLIRKDAVFKFGQQENEVFNFLKTCLVDSPVLAIYSPTDETELHCDASALGYGAILLQRKSDNLFHPISYFSKRTTDAESRYHSFELETLAIINALKRFRVYLEGIRFKIITDCNSLTLTLHKKHINPRIARWGLELENFNYSIEHRPNQRMRHVDSLSRVREVSVIEQNSFEQILSVEQGRDESINKIRDLLERQMDSTSPFELQEGLVYRKVDEKSLFYVPSVLEYNVIRANHDDLGHFGVEKVYNLITKTYWFPSIRKKVEIHIRNCLKCVQFSPNSGKVEGDLHSIPKGKLPFHTIHVDHLGPLSTTSQKYKHIFVVVDGFSKFVKLYPVRSTTSKETINCLISYFNAYSRPIRLISDRGTAFTSAEFQNFIDRYNITHIKVATASPQSNGQVERFNRLVIPILAKISGENDWNKKLTETEFAINNSKNRTINTTPSMLLFGVDQRGVVSDKIQEYLSEKANEDRNLIEIREKASNSIDKAQKANEIAFNSLHKSPRQYQEDDLVMVSNFDSTPGINKKLLPKYRGPYRVAQVLPNDRYIVTDVDNWQITQKPYKGTHAPAQMRPWVHP